MKEHDATIEVIRAELMANLRHEIYSATGEFAEHNATMIHDHGILEDCTTLQLKALWENFVSKKSPIKLRRCNPADHLSLNLCGMYIGIEPDGYTHS